MARPATPGEILAGGACASTQGAMLGGAPVSIPSKRPAALERTRLKEETGRAQACERGVRFDCAAKLAS